MSKRSMGAVLAILVGAAAGVAAYRPLPQAPQGIAAKPLAASASPAQQTPEPGGIAGPLSRELLDRYCVGCHNERTKTAGLLLDQVKLEDVAKHVPALEKVVRKLRSGQMP